MLVLTTFDDDDVLWGAVEAGAAGFLLKDAPADDLIRAIRTVAARRVVARPAGHAAAADRAARRAPPDLGAAAGRARSAHASVRSRCSTLVARGSSNVEIAEQLYVSERTVKGHVGSIFAKLGARDRAAAIVLAYDAGLVTPRQD